MESIRSGNQDDRVVQIRDLDEGGHSDHHEGGHSEPKEDPALVCAAVDIKPREGSHALSYCELRELARVPRRSRPRRVIHPNVRPDPRLGVMTSKQTTSPSLSYGAVVGGGSTYVSLLKLPLRGTNLGMMDIKEEVINLSQHQGWGNFDSSDDDTETGATRIGEKNVEYPKVSRLFGPRV